MKIKKVPSVLLYTCLLVYISTGCGTPHEEAGSEAPQDSLYSGEKFSEHIRSTEARTPEEEQAGFKLPEGFQIELFASEPDIGKPMNIAFDAQGRLWVTQSHEYPFAAKPGKGADRLSVLADTDQDGKADQFVHYEDTLNIPIGVLPITQAVLAYSIPSLYRMTDTNGDDQADQSEVVLGPFGHQDTHGMVNNFTRGYDGWVYACHGFTNTSVVAGDDGDSIRMVSGNTFRFRPDGSRVEQMTYGQVNPFGLAYDEWGYIYSTDCHTSPIYQLIRGADYPHFGKKPEGIGFAPDTKPHGEESTALSGITYYSGTQFPEEYRQNFYIGDVVTCRIHRNSFGFQGSTPVAKAETDFVKSEDPWFRPVDVKMGPDGAIYVADFYNSIIGHYEVPLDHPKRDRVRGRIWRITYKGTDKEAENVNLATASVEGLIAALDGDNLGIRMMAADQLVERIGQSAVQPVEALLRNQDTPTRQYIQALWVLHRLEALPDDIIQAAAQHSDPVVRVHNLRILREREAEPQFYPLIAKALQDSNPHVQRVAVEAMGAYPDMETLKTLLAYRLTIPEQDSHLSFTTRLCLRNLLREEEMTEQVVAGTWSEEEAATLADVMTGVNNANAGSYLLSFVSSHSVPEERSDIVWQHIARFVPEGQMRAAIRMAQQRAADDVDGAYELFSAMQQGIAQRGGKEPAPLVQWGQQLAEDILRQYFPAESGQVVADTSKTPAQAAAQQQLAINLAGKYKLTALEPAIRTSLQQEGIDPGVQAAAARALLQMAPQKNIAMIEARLQDENQPLPLKKQLVSILGEFSSPATREVLAGLKNLSPDLQTEVVMALAGSVQGRDIIFTKVKNGEIFPRTLVEPRIEERLRLNITAAQQKEWETLTADLTSVSEEKEALIQERIANFKRDEALIDSGHAVFVQHCSPCHQVGNEGGLVGPQLTGVGHWGAQALATKILDPNRNISEAFKNYTIEMKDGKVMSGLYRRDEGEVMVFANMAGQEFSVPKEEIAERKASDYTLMPDNFGERLSQADFNALLSYLLSLQ